MSSQTGASVKTPQGRSTPMPWVERWLADRVAPARVLDFACGSGRHSLLALSLGHSVLAVDRNEAALTHLTRGAQDLSDDQSDRVNAQLETRCADLEAGSWPLPAASFDVVVVTNYLFRARLGLLCTLLAPGGRLIYATFARGNERYGKPSNPDFLLCPGELLAVARRAGFQVLAYEHGIIDEPAPAMVQRLCAQRPPAGGADSVGLAKLPA